MLLSLFYGRNFRFFWQKSAAEKGAFLKISRKMFCTVEFSHMCSKINIKFRRVMGGDLWNIWDNLLSYLAFHFWEKFLEWYYLFRFRQVCMVWSACCYCWKEIMPVMFVPAAVGLIESWNSLREVLIPVAIIITVTTVFVMAVTGKVTQAMMNRKKKGEQYAGDYK